MIDINDYLDENRRISWPAYRRARRDAGEECDKCGGIIAKPAGNPITCWNCRMLDPDVVITDCSIRCPNCEQVTMVAESELFQMGDHTICCDCCNHKYDITTRVTYAFESPALLNSGKNNDSQTHTV